jgi:phosphonopyruvate decarboxylase
MIGWRGEPGVKDEPQHVHQGKVMLQSLESMDLPYIVLSDNEDEALTQTENAIQIAREKNSPVFIAVRKNSFKKFQQEIPPSNLDMSREDAVIGVASMLPDNARVVCTTGMPSRELFEYRAKNNLGHQKDFLTVGGMGHASQIALGLSKSQPNRPIYCFDGDGAALMHMGSMAIIGQSRSHNLIHIVFNNGAHASVGGQPTVGHDINFCDVAKACGYAKQIKIDSKTQLDDIFKNIHLDKGPHFIEICIRPGNKKDIGRPTSSPQENKHAIMQSLMK